MSKTLVLVIGLALIYAAGSGRLEKVWQALTSKA